MNNAALAGVFKMRSKNYCRRVRGTVTVSQPLFLHLSLSPVMAAVVLVTGGNGLVGKAIKYVIDTEPVGSRFGKKPGETWVFTSSSDTDLRFGSLQVFLSAKVSDRDHVGIPHRLWNYLSDTSPPMSSTWLPLVRTIPPPQERRLTTFTFSGRTF